MSIHYVLYVKQLAMPEVQEWLQSLGVVRPESSQIIIDSSLPLTNSYLFLASTIHFNAISISYHTAPLQNAHYYYKTFLLHGACFYQFKC